MTEERRERSKREVREERRLGMIKKKNGERGEDRVLLLLTHIEQRPQHQSAIREVPDQQHSRCYSRATPCSSARWQQPHLSNTVLTLS
ncbi:hypothetical protein EYF80_063974 [Liparis tanakae]|uniref:Uncharacterized protein n=1 Tax=Liparis tanakae TaxID=230148 RepID=A0A4Z2EBF2_9TELE|nr:hypothetical protein EYF80_063974 [Liparis tanakae]